MSPEEKAVIDDFEGEAEYEKVWANPEYWLFSTNSLNLLESSDE